jgi:ASPIC and UnbV
MNDPTGLLGLGDARRVDRLHIRWSSGIEQVLQDIPAQQLLVITRPTYGSTGCTLSFVTKV